MFQRHLLATFLCAMFLAAFAFLVLKTHTKNVVVSPTAPPTVATETPTATPPVLTKKQDTQAVATQPSVVTPIATTTPHVSTPGPLIAEEKQSTGEAKTLGESEIIILTNVERSKAGATPLTVSAELSAIARVKAEDMIAKQYFAHIAPDGTGVATLAEQYHYEFLNIGENLAVGEFDSSAEVVTGWMNSPGHRANMLNTSFTEIGVAAIQGMYKGKKVWYAVQEFGRPLSLCPGPDPLLKEEIAIYQTQLTGLDITLKNLKEEIEASAGDQEAVVAKTNAYNTIVATYNALVAIAKTAITKYNTEAQVFNVCAGLE